MQHCPLENRFLSAGFFGTLNPGIFGLSLIIGQKVLTRKLTKYAPAKTGEYPCMILPNFQNRAHISLHLVRKQARIFVLGHYLFLKDYNFPRGSLLENRSRTNIRAYFRAK